MGGITEWVKNLFIFLLAISFIEILLPCGTLKNYIKFTFSLMVLTMVIYPISSFSSDEISVSKMIPVSKQMQNTAAATHEVSNIQTKQISHIYEEKLREDIKERILTQFPGIREAELTLYINDTISSPEFGTLLAIDLVLDPMEQREEVKRYLADLYPIEKSSIRITEKRRN